MKQKQSNRTKTVDTEKRSTSDIEKSPNDHKRADNTQVMAKQKKEKKIDKDKLTGLYCIGDLPYLLFYHCYTKKWSKMDFTEDSIYKGGLKYPSIVRLGDSDTIILTGGCDNYNGEPSESVFKAVMPDINNFQKVASMNNKRYGHSAIYVKGYLWVAGGFDHQDTETTSPSTLVACERYDAISDRWTKMPDIIHPVAFAAVCSVEDDIYMFGGFEDYSTVDVIQKYQVNQQQCHLLSIKLPVRLAKMGAANIEDEQILIVGGIYEDMNSDTPLSLISNSYKLNLHKMTWSKAAKMKNKRTLNSSLYFYDNQIYALGCSNEGACEKYDPEVNRWINIPSYDHILPNNDLQSFSVCMYD